MIVSSRLDPHRAVVAAGHPRQRRQRLALRAGGDDHQLARRAAPSPRRARRAARRARCRKPSSAASPMLRTIDRPTRQTRRPCATAASSTCCTRCTWLAKQATMTRASAPVEHPVEHRADLALGDHEAGHLGVGGVDQEQVHALVAEPGEAGQVGEPAVERQLVELDVAGVQHQPGRGADGDRERVRDRVVDREVLAVERRRGAAGSPSFTSSRCGVSRCSLHLAATSASVNREPTIVQVRPLAQQERHRADVVLVAVGEHERVDVVEPVLDGPEVRQDQVDAGRVLGREQHAAVDDEQPPVVLEHGHVAADLADAAERDDAQRALGQRWRRAGRQLGRVDVLGRSGRRTRRWSRRGGRERRSDRERSDRAGGRLKLVSSQYGKARRGTPRTFSGRRPRRRGRRWPAGRAHPGPGRWSGGRRGERDAGGLQVGRDRGHLLVGGRRQRQPGVADVDAAQAQRGLGEDHAADPAHRADHRQRSA